MHFSRFCSSSVITTNHPKTVYKSLTLMCKQKGRGGSYTLSGKLSEVGSGFISEYISRFAA